MQITEMLLTNQTARPGTKIVPKGLVIHWTANEGKGADAVANRNYFNKPTTEASAHYIVDDRQIVRCLPENEMGYHVGAKSYKPEALKQLSSYPNDCTIGIEMCVNQDGDFWTMYKRTVELAADILRRYGWGVDKLWRHYDITGKNCPAYFVEDNFARRFTGLTAAKAWDKFKDDVAQASKPNPQPAQKTVDKVTVEINGKRLAAAGYLKDGVSMLPIRAVAEAVSGKVEWCAATKQVTVNGHDMTETFENGVSFAPARELAVALNLQVEWDGTTRTVGMKREQ
ncbi:N-acetylmuramoyl-L-alanine amidase [Brevibacillus sp. HD3.3A]|uniref:N-acetylmuramoyl-L-alanine amidase n=1 Tax=Brevibacillus sp. HD3.3A TaxID=2738979 RepID=UPI001E2AE449|nr:N-acetylmuramoyl-L-alanine amidase [Brevibacillus sp. HD3.3A]UED70710.1 N-acetylmuramoyl-L-alanine amidase [Brevibacillus sp. HD3.3A]